MTLDMLLSSSNLDWKTPMFPWFFFFCQVTPSVLQSGATGPLARTTFKPTAAGARRSALGQPEIVRVSRLRKPSSASWAHVVYTASFTYLKEKAAFSVLTQKAH